MQTGNPLVGKSFRGPGGEERAYRAGLWLSAALLDSDKAYAKCIEIGMAFRSGGTGALDRGTLVKAQGESMNTPGGFLVPSELQREILSLRDTVAVYRNNTRVIPIGSDNRSWPRRTTGMTVNFTPEGTAIAESNVAFDALNFVAKKLAGLVRVPSELFEDEVVGLAMWLAEEAAFSFASKEDDCGFNGDGTSAYFGISGVTTLLLGNDASGSARKGRVTASANTFGALTATDVANVMGALPEFAAATASFFISNAGAAASFYRLAQSSGALGRMPDGAPSYLGFPLALTPKLPASTLSVSGKAMMLFGDLRMAGALAERRGTTVQMSEDRYFEQDQIGVKCTERIDIVNHDVGDSTKAGPIVALVAP